MTVTEIKHAAKQQEWQERIMECRNSGVPVRRWCAERQLSITTYYRWEREIFGGLDKKGKANQTLRAGGAEVDIYAGAGEREIETVLRVLKLC